MAEGGKSHRKKKAGRKAEKRKAASDSKREQRGNGGDGGTTGARVILSDEQASLEGGQRVCAAMGRVEGRLSTTAAATALPPTCYILAWPFCCPQASPPFSGPLFQPTRRSASRTPRPFSRPPPGARPSCSKHALQRRSSGACTVRLRCRRQCRVIAAAAVRLQTVGKCAAIWCCS